MSTTLGPALNTFILLFFGGEILLSKWSIWTLGGLVRTVQLARTSKRSLALGWSAMVGGLTSAGLEGCVHEISSQRSWALSGWSPEPAGT